VIQYQSSVGATPTTVTGALTWNANGSLQKLTITDNFNSRDTQTCTNGYDDLGRLSSNNCGSAWSQTFTYDVFSNIKMSGSQSWQPTYSSSTNRMTTLPGFTPTYDANGNTLTDSIHTYTWDAGNRPYSVDVTGSCGSSGLCITYDALGRMVEKNVAGTYTEFLYGPGGSKLATMNGQTVLTAFIGNAIYSGSTLSYWRHRDWLGSARFGSTTNRTMQYSLAYAPFGATYAEAGSQE
jgi:hypothetical protein